MTTLVAEVIRKNDHVLLQAMFQPGVVRVWSLLMLPYVWPVKKQSSNGSGSTHEEVSEKSLLGLAIDCGNVQVIDALLNQIATAI